MRRLWVFCRSCLLKSSPFFIRVQLLLSRRLMMSCSFFERSYSPTRRSTSSITPRRASNAPVISYLSELPSGRVEVQHKLSWSVFYFEQFFLMFVFAVSVLKQSLQQNRILGDSLRDKQKEFWDFTSFDDWVGTLLLWGLEIILSHFHSSDKPVATSHHHLSQSTYSQEQLEFPVTLKQLFIYL